MRIEVIRNCVFFFCPFTFLFLSSFNPSPPAPSFSSLFSDLCAHSGISMTWSKSSVRVDRICRFWIVVWIHFCYLLNICHLGHWNWKPSIKSHTHTHTVKYHMAIYSKSLWRKQEFFSLEFCFFFINISVAAAVVFIFVFVVIGQFSSGLLTSATPIEE